MTKIIKPPANPERFKGFASGRFDTQAEVKRFLESCPAFPKWGASGFFETFGCG